MIADLAFAPGAGVRNARFVPRVSIPIEAACVVANGIRETLRELFGEPCDLALGEPALLPSAAWPVIAEDALLFLTHGRQTDVVLVVPRRDARRLVLRAFGEAGGGAPDAPSDACSALELHAIERIAARCAGAFDPLCAERVPGARRVRADEVPPCAAYFDLRVTGPLELTLGVAIVRDLPDPGPSGALAPAVVEDFTLELRAVLGTATLPAGAIVKLRPGDVVRLDTPAAMVQGGASASLNVGSRRLATGVGGVRGGRTSFLVAKGPFT